MTDADAAAIFLAHHGLKQAQILKQNESKAQGDTDRKAGQVHANEDAKSWHTTTKNIG